MSDFLDRINKLSPKRLALLALELHEKIEADRERAHEPIAIVGLGCRFPGGAVDAASYWALLRDGRDAIRDVPADRWDIDAYFDADPDAPGRMSVKTGGFLDQVDGFDPAFFGIAPREAQTMDPQQRLLLEVAWEALEDAGISPESLAGAPAGVFIGLCNSDHFMRVMTRGDELIDAYAASGNAPSVAAGRISYFLGLQGPALSIDTACSSSLAALHVACQSLRSGESRLALAGGVNVMCSPETTITLTKAHMLAPDGRCKTFDAAADGFARGEGCGVLVLKRRSDALAAGDRILALIRGTAANQDGRSGGLTVPNGPAQEAVIRAALADAGVAPADIGYVEAHGTGTSLGDPIEVRALAGALGAGRPAGDPLLIGSVKTNLGHLESAAGVAGVIKVVLALLHERIPPHLHFRSPSPHIAWSEYPVTVEAGGRAWPRGPRRRLAGVSSFGFSGTNAHVILEEAPPPAEPAQVRDRSLHCYPLSARSEAALVEAAGRHAAALPGLALADAAHTAGVGRAHFGERLAVVTADSDEAAAALAAFATGGSHPALHRGSSAPGHAPEVVFLYTGQGAQYPGMGRELYEVSPVYRDVIDRCDAALGARGGQSLKSVLFAAPDDTRVHETAWTQPALYAVQLALTELWRSWGIEPAAVLGHSVGEVAAAAAAGVFSLEEGLQLIAERGRLCQELPPGGSMAAIFAPVAEIEAAVARYPGRLGIATINAADSAVVSGEAAAVEALLTELAQRNIQGHRLFVSFAGHSPLVEPALARMEAAARAVTQRAPRIPVGWNLTGGAPLPGGAPDASYWRRQLREPVRFAEGITRFARDGYRTFVEIGPHPVLVALAQRSLPADANTFLGSLRRGKDEWPEMLGSLAELYVRGAAVDWAGLDRSYPRRRVTLPSYPFQRRRFWIAAGAPVKRRAARGKHALLGARLPTAVPIWETTLSPDSAPYLREHRVRGQVLVAGPVFLEIAQAAAQELAGPAARAVENFSIREVLTLPDDGRTVQTHLTTEPGGAIAFSIHSQGPNEDWRQHASGRLVPRAGSPADEPAAVLDAPAESCDAYYERIAGLGIQLGPSWRSLAEARRRPGEAIATIALPAGRAGDAVTWVHPSLLDGALQAVGLAVPEAGGDGHVYLLTEVDRIDLTAPLPARFTCHARLRDPGAVDPVEWRADVTVRGPGGEPLGVLEGVTLRRAVREGESGLGFYRVAWEPAPPVLGAAAALADPAAFVPQVRRRFGELAAGSGLAVYQDLLPALDRLSMGHVAAALRRLGFDATPGRAFTAAAEAARLGVAARHARLFTRLLGMLAEDGVLARRGDSFTVAGALPPPASSPGGDGVVAGEVAGEADGELAMLARCGPELARVLRDEQDPLQLLFPGGSFAEAQRLYVTSPYARTYNGALGEALQAAIAALPAGRRLRVLELGAGTGGTTTYVLPLLPAGRTDYTFTDLSPLFLDRAAEQFAAYPFVRRAILDVERDPVQQGFAAGAYDIVIAANVLHATADLRQAVQHARDLLAPGGLFLALEGVTPERWVDLTFGLTPGWWRFTDTARRRDYPLISRQAWLELLGELGFTGGATVPDDAWTARGGAQQALLIARAPARRRRYQLVGDGAALAERLRRRGDEITAPGGEAADEIVLLEPVLETARDWLGRSARGEVAGRIWIVTRGAVAAGGPLTGLDQAPLWGLGRVFALEQPGRWGGLIDTTGDADVLAALDAAAGDGEDQTAWRDGARLAARLVPAPAPTAAPVRFRPDATYLVTGGFGGLGLLVARWMAERGARTLALLGRRPDPTSDGVRAIEALGARVLPLAGDVADEAAMSKLLAGLPNLRGVMHAAADLGSAPLGELGADALARMLRPKIDGTRLLERLAPDLDFLALFSSTTALLGASGLGHYAAANAWLDAYAHAARQRGRRVLSVNWGTWEVMRLASLDSQQSYREAGLEPMRAAEALDALGRLLAGDEAQATVARIDWSVLKPLHEARRPRPFLARITVAAPAAPEPAAGGAPPLPDRLAAVPAAMRRDLLIDYVRHEVAAVLGVDTAVPLETGLFDLGMDSLMSVELRRRLERGAGRALPSTLTFNYPNIGALAAFLDDTLAPAAPSPAPVAAEAPPVTVPGGDDLDSLSDDELEARLLARLERNR